MEALLGVKVASGGIRANLYVANAPGGSGFTLRDEELVKALAGYARLAIVNEELLGTESALRQQTEQASRQLEAVIQASPAAVAVFDASTHRVITANAAARALTGIALDPGSPGRPEEVPLRFLNPDGSTFKPEDVPSMRAVLTGRPVGPSELVFVRPDGTRKPVLCSAAPIFSPGAGVTSVVVVFQDLTRAKELDQVKQDFFSMVTHDLRSPIATIKGIARSALEEAEGGSAAARYLDEIDEEADFLTDLVSNLLDMSRLEAGVNMFEPESCHMADIVGDALRRARRSRLAAGREIAAEVPADLPPLFADPQQTGRVLDNLLSNALKYSASPVLVRSFVDSDSRIVTEVIDRGEGVPASHIDGIFSKFFRVRQGMRRGREGAGLGLAICKAIIEAHKGEIGVRSKEREGSTFWFALPAEVRGAGF
jgi:signal transduction histidine kinase